MRIQIEVGGWEHACCGESFERDAIVAVAYLRLGTSPSSTRLVQSHHGGLTTSATVVHRGRVLDIAILHADGEAEPIHRLPSGRALRGFDEHDDGHLEQPSNGQPVINDSDEFVLTLIT